MMIATVVALGDSSKNWTPRGLTIGVNEYLCFGKQADVMILVNAPHKFDHSEMTFLQQHKGRVLTNTVKAWSKYFPQAEPLKHMGAFNLRVQHNRLYFSQTSPMIAISYAIQQGATEVVIYGVDMKTHPKYREGTKQGDHEIGIYRRFFASCERLGIKLWLGARGSVFENDLPVLEGIYLDRAW